VERAKFAGVYTHDGAGTIVVRYSWEQRKVGDLLIERNQQAPMSDEYPLMAFIANEGVSPKGERYDRSALVTDTVNKLYKKTEKGDFIYSSNNLETGSIGLNKYGKACISPVYSIFKPTGIADSDFLGRRLVRKDFINAMVKWRQGVIYGQWRIHESDFLKIEIPVPAVEEQRKIGAYLDQLDRLITLHQRKLEKLKLVKKSMLEKMFPKNGSSVPEIRFNGFTDDWEQRKLGEYVSITSGEAPSKFEEGTELYVKVDDLNYNDKYVVDTQNKVAEHSTVKRVTKGSVVFPKRGAAIMTNKVRIMGIDSYMDTNMMALTSEKLDSEFFYNIISKEGLYKIADTSTIPQINNKHVEPYEVTIPSLAEQRRIGAYFKQLDHLITLHQRKVEKLQIMKKSMLEKMFV